MNLYKNKRRVMGGASVKNELSVKLKSKKRTMFKVLLLLSLMLSYGHTHALLLSADSRFGVGTITQDTDTGLAWLDPVLGLGGGSGCCFSYNDVTTQMSAGGIFEGFRFATASELQTLFFVSAGIAPGEATSHAAIANLIGLVGDTFNISYGPDFSFFATSAYFDAGVPGQIGLASLEVESFWGEWDAGTAYLGLSPDSPSVNGGPFGSWLVLDDSATDSTPVNEPETFLILILAMLGLFARRSYKRA